MRRQAPEPLRPEVEWIERVVIVWCDARCTLATGPVCHCLCRGKFHGIGYVLPEPHGFEAAS